MEDFTQQNPEGKSELSQTSPDSEKQNPESAGDADLNPSGAEVSKEISEEARIQPEAAGDEEAQPKESEEGGDEKTQPKESEEGGDERTQPKKSEEGEDEKAQQEFLNEISEEDAQMKVSVIGIDAPAAETDEAVLLGTADNAAVGEMTEIEGVGVSPMTDVMMFDGPELTAKSAEENTEQEESMKPESEDRVEAAEKAQTQDEGLAVTLEEIRDSESVIFVNKAKRALEELDEAQKEKGKLSGELKQCEKAYSNMEKSIAEGITVALKKRKEEIAATYDRELSQYQDQIDACKTERAKAKANAIAQRIQVETAPINQQNQELEAQIDLKFKENKVPVICKKHGVSMLFFPKRAQDWVLDILIGMILLLFVPMIFAFTIKNPIILGFIFFFYIAVLFTLYLSLLHKFMLKYAGVNEEVEELRKAIRVNNKNKQLMVNRIKKSQDETGYNLGSYDDKVSSLQHTMQETVTRRQEALENFENEIRHQITADITAANKDELLALQQQFENKRQELAEKKEEIAERETELKESYESVFGKDLLYKQRLGSLSSFCQEHSELSLEEAVAQYKSSKK